MRYFLDDVRPHVQCSTGSPNRYGLPQWDGTTTVMVWPMNLQPVFRWGTFTTEDASQIDALDRWSANGGGISRERWLQLWERYAPADLVNTIAAGG